MMSTTVTSLIPSPTSLKPSYSTALQSTQQTLAKTSHALATTANQVSQQAQSLTTPSKSTPAQAVTPASTPGNFRHPQTTEILRRNASASLTQNHVKSAMTNVGALLASFIFSDVYYSRCVHTIQETGPRANNV
jgi:Ca2+-dependent lipid-binding protein